VAPVEVGQAGILSKKKLAFILMAKGNGGKFLQQNGDDIWQ
jgi:hypothetical protein